MNIQFAKITEYGELHTTCVDSLNEHLLEVVRRDGFLPHRTINEQQSDLPAGKICTSQSIVEGDEVVTTYSIVDR